MANYSYEVEKDQLIRRNNSYYDREDTIVISAEDPGNFLNAFRDILTKLSDMQEKIENMEENIRALKNDLDERERANRRRYSYEY